MLWVAFPGGKTKIGMNRDALADLIKKTSFGRMANIQDQIENFYSVSCPEHVVELPGFWMGKYETTNAQYHLFLESAGKVKYKVPPAGKPGARTLEEISRKFLQAETFQLEGATIYPVANEWRALYDLNLDALNPPVPGQDPKTLPGPDAFKSRTLPPGTEILCYRWTVPQTWRVKGRLQAVPPQGWESWPVTSVNLCDAMACAGFYGCHIPTEDEWEAACRGSLGELWPEGKTMDPIGHAWKDFNVELFKLRPFAERTLKSAQRKLDDAIAAGGAGNTAAAQLVVDRLKWILGAHDLPDPLEPPFVEVGLFPFGRASSGVLDMIGNVDEWTSTPLCRYPGTDTKSRFIDYKAYVLRGGNVLDKDSVLTATFRKFYGTSSVISRQFRAFSTGFRMARYSMPGASAASHVLERILDSAPPILPREEEKHSHRLIGPGLDVYKASGIEMYDEVAWTAAGSPKNDPPGKAFCLGKAESLCLIPATATPFHDPTAIRGAAEASGVPAAGPDDKVVDNRDPRRMPFFGVLHWSDGLSVKGEIRKEIVREVPLTPKELKAAMERAKKEKEEKEKKDSGDGKDPGGGDKPPPPKDKADDGKGGGKKGGGAAGGGDKGGGDGGGDKGGGDAGGDKGGGDPGADSKDGDDEKPDDPTKVPTTKKKREIVYEKGVLKGSDRPGGENAPTISENGVMLGLIKRGEELRAVLWEARYGSVATNVAGGTGMLEEPLVVLPKDSIDFKKVNRPLPPLSTFEEKEGEVKLVFYIAVEGREKSDWFEVTLKLKLVDYPAATAQRPWVTLPAGK
jgi:formylglycine-generating enzyme required for sulfatase activity